MFSRTATGSSLSAAALAVAVWVACTIAAATVGTVLVTTVGYLSLRKLVWGYRYLGFLATAPVAIPGIVLAVGSFSPTRSRLSSCTEPCRSSSLPI